jgi:outer membrane cobalamin receptor
MKILNLSNFTLQLLHIRSNKFLCSLFLFLIISFQSRSQNIDSVHLKLFNHSDLELDSVILNPLLISSDRLNRPADDISNELIIIEGSEIRKFGYTTLGDVLKNIPGFMVSQPGNAYEGETFIIRGLQGNENVKFMINNVPINPEAVRGMPIGAQLPIRHAQRIEISMGPSSTSFGSGCMGGYINIVMPDVDHPVYAWSDINLSSPAGSDFNLTLGGKRGLDKNIFRYQLFASSYSTNRVNSGFPNDIIDIDYSILDSNQTKFLVNTITGGDNSYDTTFNFGLGPPQSFKTAPMKKESRTMGANFQFRSMDLSIMSMYREEHSGFGIHPLQHSYHDQSLTIGEKILSVSLLFKLKNTNKCQSKLFVSYLDYRMLPYSSYFGLANVLSSGKNYMFAQSNDMNLDFNSSRIINSNFHFAYGSALNLNFTLEPFTNYKKNPFQKGGFFDFEAGDVSIAANNISMVSDNYIEIDTIRPLNVSSFFLATYTSDSGNFTMDLGVRIDKKGLFDQLYRIIPSPKIGCVYTPHKQVRLNVNFSQGFKYVA